MSAPSFDGQFLFGFGTVAPCPAINPRREQNNAYPAVNGVESLDMGDEGMFTNVSGRLVGTSLGDLQSAYAALKSYYDGNAYVLVDSMGNSWSNVKLHSLSPEGKGQFIRGVGYTLHYTAQFFHLTTI